MLLILSGPSGVGKTTIQNLLKKKGFINSISYTTRKKREEEIDKIDYFFINQENFEKKLEDNFFIEHTKVLGNYYGTSKNHISELINNKNKVVLNLDKNGFLKAKTYWQHPDFLVVGIYLLPPSFQELKSRIEKRNAPDFEERVLNLAKQLEKQSQSEDCLLYDYQVPAASIDQVFDQVFEICKKYIKE